MILLYTNVELLITYNYYNYLVNKTEKYPIARYKSKRYLVNMILSNIKTYRSHSFYFFITTLYVN